MDETARSIVNVIRQTPTVCHVTQCLEIVVVNLDGLDLTVQKVNVHFKIISTKSVTEQRAFFRARK